MKEKLSKKDKEIITTIEKGGWFVMHISGDDKNPHFSYTIGLFRNFQHPEVIIIGLRHELAHVLLNNIGYEIKNGKKYLNGNFYDDILDNFLCYFGNVPKTEYENYVGFTLWFYKNDEFPLSQCLYPTVKGLFVWEAGVSADAKFFMKSLVEKPKTGSA